MRTTRSAEAFKRDPMGTCYVGRAFVYFYAHEDLSGYTVWGRPEAADFDELATVLPTSHGPTTKPHPMLLDVRDMTVFAPDTFEHAIRYTLDHFGGLQRAVTKLAVLRPDNVAGAVAAGFFAIIRPFAPVRFFRDLAPALEWIDRESDAWVVEAVAAARGTAEVPQLVRDLRNLLEVTPGLSLDEAAERLRMSSRTLQRRLGDAGTSMTTESGRARVRVAESLLLETDMSVTEIAFKVGCASAQHFSTLFRGVHGEPPTTWRAQRVAKSGS
jgi:AraC-like DNA-binding protein